MVVPNHGCQWVCKYMQTKSAVGDRQTGRQEDRQVETDGKKDRQTNEHESRKVFLRNVDIPTSGTICTRDNEKHACWS